MYTSHGVLGIGDGVFRALRMRDQRGALLWGQCGGGGVGDGRGVCAVGGCGGGCECGVYGGLCEVVGRVPEEGEVGGEGEGEGCGGWCWLWGVLGAVG